jgi:hypothetical protein
MNNVILYSVKTDANSPTIPKSYYQCRAYGYRYVTFENNFCPDCGHKIDSFIAIRRD